jgi:hypothetical protein
MCTKTPLRDSSKALGQCYPYLRIVKGSDIRSTKITLNAKIFAICNRNLQLAR